MDDPFIRQHVEDLLRKIRTQVCVRAPVQQGRASSAKVAQLSSVASA
jgi:hypothetical protein